MQAFHDIINTYSGTASKWPHRAINAHAAQTGYALFSMDSSAACLKCMAYTEIAKLTSGPFRSMQFDFPPADAWLLRQLPGMQYYNNNLESWTL